jgi:hypothetical protein
MVERLERLRDDVRARLGQLLAGAAPDDQAIDTALVDGMTSLVAAFPILEAEVTVATTGYTQNIGAILPDVLSFLSVVYPYVPGYPEAAREPYQVTGLGVVRFFSARPAAGESMLVQYRPRYGLAGLQGSTEDTLPEKYEPGVAMAAAAHLLWMQAIRQRAAGEVKDADYDRTVAMVRNILGAAEGMVAGVSDRYANPVWAAVGL